MQYPTTVRYAETIMNPDGLFRSLSGISVSEPLEFSSGAYGAVFRVMVEGESYALKCFTRYQAGRMEAYRLITLALEHDVPYVVSSRWLEDEMIVFADDGSASEHAVLLMEWVEGVSLTRAIDMAMQEPTQEVKMAVMSKLAQSFDRLVLWLLEQPFAHGDLKPDNIMVRTDGELVLIDYDGIYLPAMAGERARENGTEGFRHPARSENEYGKHIDDFSIALISMSLRALARWPELYKRFHGSTTLMFSPELLPTGECSAYNYLKDTELADDPLFVMLGSGAERLAGLGEAMATHCSDAELCVNYRTDTVTDTEYDYMGEAGEEDVCMVRSRGKYGFVASDGRVVAACIYDRAKEFSEGAAAVCIGDRWGFIGTQGEMLTEDMIYDDCGSFSEGLTNVCIAGKWGYVDGAFKVVCGCRFNDAWPFAQGKGLVRRGAKYGYVGRGGSMVIPARYDFAQGFCEDAACVMVGGLYGYISQRGRYIVEPSFDYARNKRDGRAYVETAGKGREIEIL